MKTFIDKCLNKTAHVSQIDDYVKEWHRIDSNESLHEYLGMTYEEYCLWISNPDALEDIIKTKNKTKKI